MTGTRVVVVAPQFWPMVGSAATLAGWLVDCWVHDGHAVTVVTRRDMPSWPTRFMFRGAWVERMPPTGRFQWSRRTLHGHLGKWLRARRNEAAGAFVLADGCDCLELAAELAAGETPLATRLDPQWIARQSDQRLRMWATSAKGNRPESAPWLIAPCPAVGQRLRRADWPAERITLIPDEVRMHSSHTAAGQAAARNALGRAYAAFEFPIDAPLALCPVRLDDHAAIERLARIWVRVVRRQPNARLWLVGPGTISKESWHEFADRGIGGHVVPAGVFDNLGDVLAAADAMISLEPCTSAPLPVAQALAAGLPIVEGRAGEAVPVSEPAGDAVTAAAPDDLEGWSRAILHLLSKRSNVTTMSDDPPGSAGAASDPDCRSRLAAMARRYLQTIIAPELTIG